MSKEITADWLKYAQDCNADSGYPHGITGGQVLSELKKRWEQECPGLETPWVEWSNSHGYEVKGLGVARRQS